MFTLLLRWLTLLDLLGTSCLHSAPFGCNVFSLLAQLGTSDLFTLFTRQSLKFLHHVLDFLVLCFYLHVLRIEPSSSTACRTSVLFFLILSIVILPLQILSHLAKTTAVLHQHVQYFLALCLQSVFRFRLMGHEWESLKTKRHTKKMGDFGVSVSGIHPVTKGDLCQMELNFREVSRKSRAL